MVKAVAVPGCRHRTTETIEVASLASDVRMFDANELDRLGDDGRFHAVADRLNSPVAPAIVGQRKLQNWSDALMPSDSFPACCTRDYYRKQFSQLGACRNTMAHDALVLGRPYDAWKQATCYDPGKNAHVTLPGISSCYTLVSKKPLLRGNVIINEIPCAPSRGSSLDLKAREGLTDDECDPFGSVLLPGKQCSKLSDALLSLYLHSTDVDQREVFVRSAPQHVVSIITGFGKAADIGRRKEAGHRDPDQTFNRVHVERKRRLHRHLVACSPLPSRSSGGQRAFEKPPAGFIDACEKAGAAPSRRTLNLQFGQASRRNQRQTSRARCGIGHCLPEERHAILQLYPDIPQVDQGHMLVGRRPKLGLSAISSGNISCCIFGIEKAGERDRDEADPRFHIDVEACLHARTIAQPLLRYR